MSPQEEPIEVKHSPEPWTYDGETEKVMSATGDVVASCWGATAAEAHANGRRIAALSAENARLREALAQIEKAEGPYSSDPLTHASNTIEDMTAIARAALAAQEAP